MQIKEFDIILDIKKYKKIDEIEVVQGDLDTNQLNITIYDGLDIYSLENLNIEIAFAKSDGTTVLQSSQDEEKPIIIEGDKIICTLKTNTIAAPGKVLSEVRILEDTRLLTSARFEFYVRKAIVNDETIESTNEFPLLNKLVKDVEGIVETVPVIEGKLDEITNTESGLNQSILEGNTLKRDLDSSIQEGNLLKDGLDNSIVEGNAVKGELDDIIAGTDYEQVLAELNNKADKTELESLAGEGRTTETVKDNADKIGILNGVGEAKEKANKSDFETHLAEIVSQTITITRDAGILGIQTIPTIPDKTIKGIILNGIMVGQKQQCILFKTGTAYSRGTFRDDSGNMSVITGLYFKQDTKIIFGTIVTKTGSIEIEWKMLAGTDMTGTINVDIQVLYHGE